MNKKIYKTISPAELGRLKRLDVKNLHFYQQLFQDQITGRKADIKFYNLQKQLGQTNDEKYFKSLKFSLFALEERLEVINLELDNRALNHLRSSIN